MQEGHTVAASINATLRSGKNAFFGTAYEFIRNEALNANEFFSNRAGRAKQPFRYNRYGGSIGGPVWFPKRIFGPLGYDGRDQTFFFYVHESLPLTVSLSNFLTVPTAKMRTGDFSELLSQNIKIYDPDPAKVTRLANGQFTRAASNGATLQGQRLAQYLLGIPSSGTMPRTDSNVVRIPSHAGFVQDDWNLSSKLTLNLELRYEYDGTAKDRFNRAVARYDINAKNPIEAAVQAAHAAKPIPEIPVGSFRVPGGALFADGTDGALYNVSGGNFSPRLGLAYALNGKTVLRGGVGWYTNPFTFYAPDQTGYSLSTPIVASTDNNLTPLVTFADPFPNGILEPVRNTRGLASANGLGSFYYSEREHARAFKYTFFVQRELPGNWVLEVGYNGSHGFNQPVTRDVNALPLQYLSRSLTRDVRQLNFLNAQVPNPFFGLTPLNPGFSASVNTARSQLLRPFPQLSGLSTEIYNVIW